jgi:nucleotide-binding universal stress UspA family protein
MTVTGGTGALRPRKFLVVADGSPESRVALRYVARRAQHTGGRVTLLGVAEPGDIQQWRGVEEIMRDEAHAEAESLVHAAAKLVNELTGILSELVVLYGRRTDCLKDLIAADKDISILVLAAATSKDGPGLLVSTFVASADHAIPVTIVPGGLTDEAIDALA